MPQAQESWRHHYLPEFYLKRWASKDGRLVQFSKPFKDTVKPLRVHPRRTGFVDRLYELRGLPPDEAQDLESVFFKPVDTRAATVLEKIERGVLGFSADERSAWTQFVMSLTLRYPEMLQAMLDSMRAMMREDLNSSTPPAWMTGKDPSMLDAMRRVFKSGEVDAWMSRSVLAAAVNGIANKRIGQELIDKKWGMLRAPIFAPALLTSDRPVLWHAPLAHPEFCMLLPVGPKTMFYAVNEGSKIDVFLQSAPKSFAPFVNEQVTRRAVRFVYGLGDGALGFIQSRMGVDPIPNQADEILESTRNLIKSRVINPGAENGR